MKKRLMSILISAMMILTSLAPITASAEETVNIFEAYTFEEFLALSEEEICSISPYIQSAYEESKERNEFLMQYNPSFCRYTVMIYPEECNQFILEWNDNWTDCIMDYNALLAALKLPEEFFAGERDIVPTSDVIVLFDENGESNTYYTGYDLYADKNALAAYPYDESEIVAKIFVWLFINPIVVFSEHDEYCGEEITKPSDEPVILYGDINMDSKIGILDIIALNKYLCQIITLNKTQILAADFNCDENTNIADIIALMCYIVGKDDVTVNI